MSQDDDTFAGTRTATPGRFVRWRVPLWLCLLVVALLLLLIGWREWTHYQTVNQREAAVEIANNEAARQFGMALAWAVRGEMMRSNLGQIDQYFTEIIKLPGMRRAVLAGKDGRVVLSTDRRVLGAAVGSLAPATALQQAQVSVLRQAGDARMLVVPILGLNSRLGTVLVDYRPPARPAVD